MGWDLIAHFDIDQRAFEEFFQETGIDRDDWNESNKISDWFKKKYCTSTYICPIYEWNKSKKCHEMFEFYGINSFRDDHRLLDNEFHHEMKQKIGQDFPECLKFMMYCCENSTDAKEIAREIRVFFADDPSFLDFAKWLDETSKYCSKYTLST